MAELKNTIVNGVLNVNGDVIASKIIKRGDAGGILRGNGNVIAMGTGSSKFLREDGTWATVSTSDTGATSIEVTGTGNAVTTASYDASTRKITLTKGTTFLTSHQSLTDYVKGPGNSTDNAIARFNSTTGKLIQNSRATIDDTGNLKINNSDGGDIGLILGRGSSNADWRLLGSNGNFYIQGNYTTSKQTSFYSVLTLAYNSGNATVKGSVTANGFKHSDSTTGTNDYILLAGGGTKAVSDFSTSDTKVTQSNTTTANWRKVVLSYQDSSTAGTATTSHTNQVYVTPNIEAQPSTGNVRIAGSIYEGGTALSSKYAAKTHTHTKSEITDFPSIPNPTNYYWANVKVASSSSTATTPSVQKIGITGSTTTTASAAVTMEYDSSYKALKFVFA